MTARVDIAQLTHRFGSFTALKDIDLTIAAGSFAVLLGPSGCGKTTLLSVLGGFLRPSAGSILLDGQDVTQVPPAKRGTTTMFQDYALFPHMNLLDNVGFGPRMRGHSRKRRRQQSLQLLELVGLHSEAQKKPHELSGGQRQRVALARALAVDPDVLLLDEPLGALDLKLRRQMQDELKAIQKRVGTTFIHVTHDQEEAMAIADEIIVMNGGVVVDQGSPESIYLHPASTFSAAFMGDANLIDGRVLAMDSHTITVTTEFGQLNLNAFCNVNQNIGSGDRICVCFRPEHVLPPGTIAEHPIDLGLAVIRDSTFFGSHQRYQLLAADGSIYIAQLPQSASMARDSQMPLRLDGLSLVVLRAE